MLSFYGDKEIKAKYVNRVIAHRKADNLVRGKGWENGKGCAIGCTLESYNHRAYETELGIPEWLARVEDKLYEGMSFKKSKTWPEKFLKAIKPGVNLDKVKGKFLIVVLNSALKSFDSEKHPRVVKSIKDVIKLYKKGGTPEEFKVASHNASSAYAADAAYAAADAASAAAYAAASSAAASSASAAASAYAADAAASAYAYAADAAYAAAYAADAAYAAAYAASAYAAYAAYAADAAYAAADAASAYAADAAYADREKTYNHLADELLKILKGIKK